MPSLGPSMAPKRTPRSDPRAPASALALLAAYHDCMGNLLVHLEDLLAERRLSAGERQAVARDLLASFDCALEVHLGDEEDDVFPALLAAAQSPARRAQAFELVASLLVDHREMAGLWAQIRSTLGAIGAIGEDAGVPFPEPAARRFVDLCRRHLEREERELGDLVRRIPGDRLEAVTRSIERRRSRAGDCCARKRRKAAS